jgi:hypothetical protein
MLFIIAASLIRKVTHTARKSAYWFSLNTPKALANASPEFELARTLGTEPEARTNAESVGERGANLPTLSALV